MVASKCLSFSESREELPAKRQRQSTLFAHFFSKECSSDVRELESREETSGNVSETESVDQTGSISVDHSEGNDNDNNKDVVPSSSNPRTYQGECCQLRDQKEPSSPAARTYSRKHFGSKEVSSGHFPHTGTKTTPGSPCAQLQ